MVNQTELTRAVDQVSWLREVASQGLIFSTLTTELAALQDHLPRHARTPVTLPGITATQRDRLLHLFDRVKQHESLPDLTPGDWELVITQLGSADAQVRMNLAAPVFNAALASQDQSPARLRATWELLASPAGLLFHIDEPQNQGCVVRATAVTGLAMLLYADRQGPAFLPAKAAVHQLSELAVVGLLWEQDCRGFVNRLGWVQLFGAYTVLLNELSHREVMTRGEQVLLMGAYLTAYRRLRGPLIMGEAEEGADYLIRMIGRHPLYQRFFLRELREWQLALARLQPQQTGDWNRLFNYRRLMQGLLLHPNLPAKIAQQILD